MLDKLIDALDSVTLYNGLAEDVASWKYLEPNDYNSIPAPDNIVIPKTDLLRTRRDSRTHNHTNALHARGN